VCEDQHDESSSVKTKFFELFQFSVSTMQGCMNKNLKCTKKIETIQIEMTQNRK